MTVGAFRVVLVLAAALASAACGAGDPAGENGRGAGAYTVSRGDLHRVVTLTGSLWAPKAARYVAPRGAGWRQNIKWLVDEGAIVRPGDPIVRLDATTLTADEQQLEIQLLEKRQQRTLREAEGERERLEAELRVKRAEAAAAKARLDASAPAGMVGQKDHRQRQIELARAERELEQSREARSSQAASLQDQLARFDVEIKAAEADLRRAREAMEAMTIRASAAGPVIYEEHYWYDRKIQVGDNVSATQPLVTIPEPGAMEVAAWSGETDAALLAPGQPVELRLDAAPARVFHGKVKTIAPSADPRPLWGEARYFRVTVSIDDRDESMLRPGMSVQCRVDAGALQDVLLAPLEAVAVENDHLSVRPQGGGKVEVKALGHDAFAVALAPAAGLSPGQRLEAPRAAAD